MVVLGGSSHPQLTESICNILGIPPGNVLLGKFSVGETRVEIQESVRGKDVYVIQSGSGRVNDNLMELLITISACKTASARKVTVVLPLFPYSRQSDIPYNKIGAPLTKAPVRPNAGDYTFDSRPQSPRPGQQESSGGSCNGTEGLHRQLAKVQVQDMPSAVLHHGGATEAIHNQTRQKRSDTSLSSKSESSKVNGVRHEEDAKTPPFEPQRGYRQWVAQAGTLVADLLTCAGTDHVITMDLHDPQYQGFFDIPVDNLYGRHLLRRYIEREIPNYQEAVIVSPDAGGAKRATAIADALGMPFALIHKVSALSSPRAGDSLNHGQERRPAQPSGRQNASMILVGNVAERTAILVDDLADTSNTITRAAKLLKKEGATRIFALVTHGVLSGDAIDRINHSALDKVVVTNSVDQREHKRRCSKLEVLEVAEVFAEVRYPVTCI